MRLVILVGLLYSPVSIYLSVLLHPARLVSSRDSRYVRLSVCLLPSSPLSKSQVEAKLDLSAAREPLVRFLSNLLPSSL